MKIYALMAASLVFSACGKSTPDTERFSQLDDTTPVTAMKLIGTWSTGCQAAFPNESRVTVANSRLFRIEFITGGVYRYQEYAYSDTACRNRVLFSEGEGSFTVRNNGRIIAQNLGYQQVTPLTDSAVTAMNRSATCSYSAWRNGTARNVLLSNCAPLRLVESDAGFRETGELVMNFCAPRVSSTAKCESFFFMPQ